MQIGVKLLDSTLDGTKLDFCGKPVVEFRFLDVLFERLVVELALNVVSHPLDAILFQVGLHLVDFLLELRVL